MKQFRFWAVATFLGSTLLAHAALGTTWNVPGDPSADCTPAQPSCPSLAAALAVAAAGDTIALAAASFAETGVAVTTSVTIAGAGPDSTFLEPAGVGLLIDAPDVVLRDLTIRNATDGIRIGSVATAVSGTQVRNVHFLGSTSDGIEIGTTQVTDMTVEGCVFRQNYNGIRLASRSTVNGLDVSNSRFEDNTTAGIYQANDGNTSTLAGLSVRESTFSGNGNSGLYIEELRDATIESNVFRRNYRGIMLFKNYATSGVGLGNVFIRDNDFVDMTVGALYLYSTRMGLAGPVEIEGNRFREDVGVLTFPAASIDIRLRSTFSHAPVSVRGNQVTFSGSFVATTGAYAISVRGNGPVEIASNVLDGGGVGGSATPPTSGIFVRTSDSTFGTLPATATITASCNRISGFEHGLVVFDPVNGVYGGLPTGANVVLAQSSLTSNALAGVANGELTQAVSAAENWWGCSDGPGQPGCDSSTGNVATEPALSEAPACLPCTADAACDDADPCTQDSCTNVGACLHDPTPRPSGSCYAAVHSSLQVQRGRQPGGNQLLWKWRSPDGIDQGAFGAPPTSSDYALCVYDSVAGVPTLATTLTLPAATPGWRALPSSGWRFMDNDGLADGIRAVRLKTDARGGTTLSLRARGPALPLPALAADTKWLAQDPAVVVQLTNGDGVCWTSEWTSPATKENTAGSFHAKSSD